MSGLSLFATGDGLATQKQAYRLDFPNNFWFVENLMADLRLLLQRENWDKDGDTEIDDAIQQLISTVENFEELIDTVGMIFPFAGDTAHIPAGVLLCDGASYAVDDQPELFQAIGYAWGSVDADHFNVPDLRSAGLIGAGDGPGLTHRDLATFYGEETHTLIGSEVPSHSHTDLGHTHVEGIAAPNVTTIGAGAPQPTAVPAIGATGSGSANLTSSGGDGAHNNIEPNWGVTWVIATL